MHVHLKRFGETRVQRPLKRFRKKFIFLKKSIHNPYVDERPGKPLRLSKVKEKSNEKKRCKQIRFKQKEKER